MNFIVKNTTILNPLDLLAPHSCRGCGRLGDVLCDRCKNHIISHHVPTQPAQKPKNFPPIFAIGKREGLLDLLIHDFKYNSVRAIGPKLAELMSICLPELPMDAVIIPLPTATSHIRARGLDHTLMLAKQLARLRHLKVKRLLLREKNTIQVGSNRQTRLAQANSAYSVNSKIEINPNTTYVLLDDVWTTGASMQAAVKKLRQAGAHKIIIALLAISSLD